MRINCSYDAQSKKSRIININQSELICQDVQ